MATCGSLFDGIGCFSLAFQRAGWDLRWTVEIDADCRRVTKARFPGVRQYEDVCEVGKEDLEPVDLVLGGSPCQGLSVAGRRGGLDDDRSSLFVEMARVVDELSPLWVLWENVPGAFTTAKGEDFACVLGHLTGYYPVVPVGGWRSGGVCVGPKRTACWRVLDAQYFGLAQRRKRIFLVARSGDVRRLGGEKPWRDAGRLRGLPVQVLFESDCLPGNPAPRRETGSHVTHGVTPGAGGAGGRQPGGQLTAAPVTAFDKYNQTETGDVACTIGAGSKIHNNAHVPHLIAATRVAGEQLTLTHDVAPTLQEREGKGQDRDATRPLDHQGASGGGVVPIDMRQASRGDRMTNNRAEGVSSGGAPGTGVGEEGDPSPSLAGSHTPAIAFHATQDPISGEVSPAMGAGNSTGCGSIGVAYKDVVGSLTGNKPVGGWRCGPNEAAAGHVVAQPTTYTIHAAESCAKVRHAHQTDTARSLDTCGGFATNQGGTVVKGAAAMTVRRLTPTECLRLQGLPDDLAHRVIIRVCSDHQKKRVLAESQSPRWQNSVGNASSLQGDDRFDATASCADESSGSGSPPTDRRAVLSAAVRFGGDGVLLHRPQDGQLLFAGTVERSFEFHRPKATVSFARATALIGLILGQTTGTGKAETRRSDGDSIVLPSGCLCLVVSEDETGGFVEGAGRSTGEVDDLFRFITSGVTSTTLNYDLTLKTLCFFVATVISSSHPSAMSTLNSFDLDLSIRYGWLDVTPPLSDSTKYRQIGNGGAVPCVEWIAKRIHDVETEMRS